MWVAEFVTTLGDLAAEIIVTASVRK